MRATFLELVLFSTTTMWAADKIQPLNVKPGLWETTSTVTRSGEMPIPAEFLAQMTPEQRAKLEARMKANAAQNTKTHTYKTCETKEKLQRTPFADAKECSFIIVSSTSSKAELRMSCRTEGLKSRGDMLVEALSPESIRGSGHMTATGGGRNLNMNTMLSSKWLGSTCGDIK